MFSVSIREEPRRPGDFWRRSEERRLARLVRRQLVKEDGTWQATLLPSSVLRHWWLLELRVEGNDVVARAWLDTRSPELRAQLSQTVRGLRCPAR